MWLKALLTPDTNMWPECSDHKQTAMTYSWSHLALWTHLQWLLVIVFHISYLLEKGFYEHIYLFIFRQKCHKSFPMYLVSKFINKWQEMIKLWKAFPVIASPLFSRQRALLFSIFPHSLAMITYFPAMMQSIRRAFMLSGMHRDSFTFKLQTARGCVCPRPLNVVWVIRLLKAFETHLTLFPPVLHTVHLWFNHPGCMLGVNGAWDILQISWITLIIHYEFLLYCCTETLVPHVVNLLLNLKNLTASI